LPDRRDGPGNLNLSTEDTGQGIKQDNIKKIRVIDDIRSNRLPSFVKADLKQPMMDILINRERSQEIKTGSVLREPGISSFLFQR